MTSMALLPQVFKIYNSRSARDISTGMFIVFCIGISLWIIYGFAIDSLPVVLANCISLILGIIIIWMKFKYR
jgi:MtN3 and saliva related transmembrane protein